MPFTGQVWPVSRVFSWFWLVCLQVCCSDGPSRCRVPGQAIQLQWCWCTPTDPAGRVKHSSVCFHIPLSFHALFPCLSINVHSMLSECLCLMEISFKNLFFPSPPPSQHPSTRVTLSCTNMLAACECLQIYIGNVNVFLPWQRIFFARRCLFQTG